MKVLLRTTTPLTDFSRRSMTVPPAQAGPFTRHPLTKFDSMTTFLIPFPAPPEKMISEL